ncbi:MAG: HEAT repeat domain-containing protein [Bacteroidota bacterium]
MPITDDILLDYLKGEVNPRVQQEVEAALAESEALRRQLAYLKTLTSSIQALPLEAPSADLRTAFDQLIEQENDHGGINQNISFWKRAIAASVLLMIGIWIGKLWTGEELPQRKQQQQVVHLMQQEKSSIRMKAVSMSMELPSVDEALLSQLTHLLLNDESVGVRLAALDALLQLEPPSSLAGKLLAALKSEQKPVVQIALIQALVELKTEEAVPLFQDLINADSTFKKVKDEAHIGTFKLI